MNSIFSPLQEPLARLKGRSLLAVCSSGVAAEARFAIDPEYRRRIEEAGGVVSQAYYEQITVDLLAGVDVVYLTGFPKTDALEDVEMILREKAPLLDAFVRAGGGLLVFVDDHYARLFDPLNRFLKPFGIEVLCELMFDKNRANAGELPSSPEIATLLTGEVLGGHPVNDGVKTLEFPNGWQSGIWPLKCDAPEWEPLVYGEPTVESRVLWQETVATWPARPPLCAVRPWGNGRLGVLPVHPTFFVGNGYHRRWDGHFFRKHDNDRFLGNLLSWLGEKSARTRFVEAACLIAKDQTMDWFRAVPPREQAIRFPVHKGLFGLRSDLSGGTHPVRELCTAARNAGFSWVAFAEKEEELTEEAWLRLVEECAAASDGHFQALPGVDFNARNDFGNRGVAILPRYWPRKQENKRFIIQMIEEGGGFLIFSNPSNAAVPAWNNGGFQGLEVARYDGEGRLLESAFKLYENLQAHDWFQVPIVRFDITTPQQIANLADFPRLLHTYIAAPAAGCVADYVPRVENMEFQEVFVSSGPVVEEFWLEGPGCIKDVWEGRYYVWSDREDEALSIHLRCSAPYPITEVRLWDNDRECAAFYPGSKHYETVVERFNDRLCRSFRVVIKDAIGNEAWSTVRRVRNNHFQAHGGGDRMNTYGSVYFPHPQGEFTLLGERCSASATMLFGLGWRQHHLNIYPPVATVDFHPEGGEWGAPSGRLERVFLNPVFRDENGIEFERPLEGRLGFCFAGEEAAQLQDWVSAKEVIIPDSKLDGYIPYPRPHLDKCSPGVAVRQESEFIKASMSYTFGRWRPEGGPLVMRMDVEVLAKRDLTVKAGEELGLRLLRLETDLDRFVNELHYADPEGIVHALAFPDDLANFDLAGDGFSAVTEQPYGSFGVYQVAGKPFSIRAGRRDGRCEIQIGWRMMDGTRFCAGHRWEASLLLVITGNPQGGSFFETLHRALAMPDANRWRMVHGSLVRTDYPVEMSAEDGAVIFQRRLDLRLSRCGVDELVRIGGLNPSWSAFGRPYGEERWVPLALRDDGAFWTLPDRDLQAMAGHPVMADERDLEIQVQPIAGGLRCRVHNAACRPRDARIFTNPAFHEWTGVHARLIRLEPGSTDSFTFPHP